MGVYSSYGECENEYNRFSSTNLLYNFDSLGGDVTISAFPSNQVVCLYHVEMIQNFFTLQLAHFPVNENTLFQQDGATSYTARISMDTVNVFFPSRAISRKEDITWPPRSPDLTVCDFFLWGHLKTKVFGAIHLENSSPKTTSLREEVAAIPVNMLRGVMQQFVARLESLYTRIVRSTPTEGNALWGIIKQHVLKHRYQTIEDLKEYSEFFSECGKSDSKRKKNKVLRFAADMALLAEEELILRDMLLKLYNN
ncbi:hypothetical protein ANN_25884 [Periplaneta americana]|uniref:Uncharacterized protein n=1 Tax=Periplaneta americana TaxID=6978 RepID=A0ABQ8S4F5_PERAM|nr:hypothetical protein ANN_25884 [Periplaneta americana]